MVDIRRPGIGARLGAMLDTEEGKRLTWLSEGRPEVLWTGEAAGHKVDVVESDADSMGKRRKRRVRYARTAKPLTAKQARELGEALITAAEHASKPRRP
jgi:hypothetical protein